MSDQPVFTDYVEGKGGTKLPTFKGYTVDMRLKEFRVLEPGKKPEFLPFNSEQGDLLLAELIEYLQNHGLQNGRLYEEITSLVLDL
jgi:hypothetical protein